MAPTGSKTPSCLLTSLLAGFATLLVLLLLLFHDDILSLRASTTSQQPLPAPFPTTTTSSRSTGTTNSTYSYTFRAMPRLEDLSSAQSSEDAFEALLPQSGGFLIVKSNRSDVTEATGTPGEEHWGISMFHGIHCLSMIHSVLRTVPTFQHLQAPLSTPPQASPPLQHIHPRTTPLPGHGAILPSHDPAHIGHCIAYLAQSLLCAADGTIEPPWIERGPQGEVLDVGVSGEGVAHTCRGSGLLWEVAERSLAEGGVRMGGWRGADDVWAVFGGGVGRKGWELVGRRARGVAGVGIGGVLWQGDCR